MARSLPRSIYLSCMKTAICPFFTGFAACFDTCLESDCEGVTVAWGASGNVDCFLRKGIDTSNCLDGNTGDTWYTTFTRD